MNKKLLIGLITAAVAVVVAIVMVILIAAGVFTFNKDTETTSSDLTSSQTEVVVDKGVLEFESANAKAGDTVTVPVTLKKNPGIWGAQLSIVYDPEVLSVSACTNGIILDEFNYHDDQDGVLRVLVTNSALEDAKKDGLLCNLIFTVKDGAAAGEYELQVTNDSLLCNVKEETVSPEIILSKITIS